jgi:hypothetical protein
VQAILEALEDDSQTGLAGQRGLAIVFSYFLHMLSRD